MYGSKVNSEDPGRNKRVRCLLAFGFHQKPTQYIHLKGRSVILTSTWTGRMHPPAAPSPADQSACDKPISVAGGTPFPYGDV